MKKFIALILIPIVSWITSFSQELSLFEDLASEIIENGNTSDTEHLYEVIEELTKYPLNLNFATESELNATGLFTPFQVYGILKQREKYGHFHTIYELAVIPGFTVGFLKQIVPLVTFSNDKIPDKYQRGKGMLLSNVSNQFPYAQGFQSRDSTPSRYPGSPFKVSGRLKYDTGRKWTIGGAFEKDRGEIWLNKQRPEHFTGYIAYKPQGIINSVIWGNYRIHRGMGLVHGLGFNSNGTGVNLDGYRRSYAKPFSSSMEYDYYRGIYTEAVMKKWTCDLFWSFKPEDLSFHNFALKTDLFEQIRKTGLHRTSTERNGFGLANQHTTGFSINRSAQRLYTGISYTYSKLGLSNRGLDSIGAMDPVYSQRTGISLYGVGFGTNYEVFGEAALGNDARYALLIGTTLAINPALSASISIRRYQPDFAGFTPNAYGAGGDPENESGINVELVTTPFKYARIYLNSDFSGIIKTRHNSDLPGFNIRNSIRFSYEFSEGPIVEFRFTGRTHHELLKEGQPGNGNYMVNQQTRYRLQYRYDLTEKLKISGRFEYATLLAENASYRGKLFYEQVTVNTQEGFRFTYRFLIFDTNHWGNRIYTYEPGVRYSFLFPAWYGTGLRNVFTFSARISGSITIRAKGGYTRYSHRWETGSGYDVRPGNEIWDAELQLQLDL
ncbi:MAG: hypothetical protein WD052_11010 [Bacteroidales bacterium]